MSIEEDARAFGQHFKQGGWRLAFLVARSCDPESKGGRPPLDGNRSPVNGTGKVSFRSFAEMAGVSPATVHYHYNAWKLAAEEGHCAPPVQLLPDSEDGGRDDLAEGDEEDRKLWLKFYRQVRESGNGPKSHGGRAGHRSSSGRKSRAKADSAAGHSQSDSTSRSNTEHPLYGLLLDINRLADELKFGSATTSLVAAAKKVASKEHRAALCRVTGAI
ncbi:hypothetical protein [Mycobacterium sp. 852002-10029_SCH5224772]|uniref:hypothetical protein n=1 Tax=Mycobacterium sp. 852002-10029_SCH5224772 TaxID=1834083 RepID=UPI000ABFBD4E|nr:hypothetical protein [Mycobacterium sp. 852002-10029_SCH5224772]